MASGGPNVEFSIDGTRITSEIPLSRLTEPVRSLYIHVPFCFHKCHYCDFYSFVDNRDRQADYLAALRNELDRLARAGGGMPLQTIFVGGGTPSLLRPELWEELLEHLAATLTLAPDAEFTVECNPETVTPELMHTLRAGGVTRVSIGAQSFNPTHLKTLERWHDPVNVPRAVELATEAGIEHRSIDLIFGIPGQTVEEWEADLDRALALDVDHMSCYALTYEPGTAMTARLNRGDFEAIDHDIEARMYERTLDRLGSAGFSRYEISNFARPGGACAHNLVYWRGGAWLAAGPSASGHAAGFRWKNVPRLTDWMEGVAASAVPVVDLEWPDALRALAERLMLGIRLAEGLPCVELRALAAECAVEALLNDAVASAVGAGHLVETADRWVLTDHGMLFADAVAADLMDAIQPSERA